MNYGVLTRQGMATSRNNALALSYITVGYNILEGLISVGFAVITGSPALLGFGVDSFVESLSGTVMVWRFSGAQQRESPALRLVGASLIVLAGYVMYESATDLLKSTPPERSIAGLIIAGVSLITMPILYTLKQRVATQIGSKSLAVDAKQTLACILLSIALLMGTGLHYVFGLWQADPLAGLLIAAFLIRDGYEAWREGRLCC
jgi:divalent metal cation (Fe/Co/Zn/Cd) transporter